MPRRSKSDLGFERDPRRKREIKGRPFADAVYRDFWGPQTLAMRTDTTLPMFLDREYGIDVQLSVAKGMKVTGQEKFLSFAGGDTVTVELFDDPKKGQPGDWFRMIPQFYFVAYFNDDESGFRSWIMLDWAGTIEATVKGHVSWKRRKNQDGRAKADFVFCPFAEFPSYVVFDRFPPPGVLPEFDTIEQTTWWQT